MSISDFGCGSTNTGPSPGCPPAFAHDPDKTGIHLTDIPFFLDTQEMSQRFGDHISEFRSLFDTNHIRHGSPDNIFEFATVLESANQFRFDLSAMVKSVVQRESDELLLTDMMSIIVASVGGPSFSDIKSDITRPTNALMEFLLGTGCWRQFGLPLSPTSQSAVPPIRPSVRAEEPSPTQISPAVSIPIAGESAEDRDDRLDAPSELRQMLTRLERNTFQVERHLKSIEQRLSRIESPPKPLLTQTPSPIEPFLHTRRADIVSEEIAQPLAEGVPVFEAERPTRSRALFSHHPHQPQKVDFPSPTFAKVNENRWSIIPIGVFLALLAIIAASLFAHSGQGRLLLKAGVSHVKTVYAHFSRVPAAVSHEPPAASPRASIPASIAAPAPAPPAGPPTSPKIIVATTPRQSVASDNANPHISPNAPPIPDSPEIRYIPANLMEGYLLSAPRPEYPDLARIDHIEGSVALQATISKNGLVETLHVTKGPPRLRNAAVDAVRHWRYKPYSVSGRPVEVATTVYVHFTLSPLPAIAH
jgi:TonB family protein